MGMPYSKQINAAFDQVTPLVAEGYKVLETIKNLAVLLAWIQVLTVALLGGLAVLLLALLVTLNPDLADERRLLVTPAVRWLCARVVARLDFAARHPCLGAAGAFALLAGLVFAACCLTDWIDPHLELRRRADTTTTTGPQDGRRRSSAQASDKGDEAEE